jgi:hypothetical protein
LRVIVLEVVTDSVMDFLTFTSSTFFIDE